MELAVISDKGQYKSLAEKGFLNGEKMKVLCDNPSLHPFLKGKGVVFEELGEEDIRWSWEEINVWACEKALLWEDLIDGRAFGGVEMNKALYVFYSYYLVAFLKNFLMAELIVDRYGPDTVLVFGDVKRPDFHRFNGNYFLNLFLEHACRARGVRTRTILSGGAEATSAGGRPVKERLRSLIEDVYCRTAPWKSGEGIYVFSGSIRHLGDLMREMISRGQDILFHDFEFGVERLAFCLRNGARYTVPENMLGSRGGNRQGKFDFSSGFAEVLEKMKKGKWFLYKGTDLSGVLCNELARSTRKYIAQASFWAEVYESMIGTRDVRGLVVDEDWTPRKAFMASFFGSRGINTFCVSHGFGPVRFSLDEASRKFHLCETFVNSEYEKSLYASKGWDGKHLHVTGVPRYDRIVRLKEKKGPGHSRGKMRIMYCAGTILDYRPDWATYAGGIEFEDGRHLRKCLADLIKAVNGYDIELIIRPHNVDEARLWGGFIAPYKDSGEIRLVSARSDFFDLLSGCDAMFLSHWSTAILEGAIFGIPTVVLNYSGLDDAHPYGRDGICAVVRDPGQLKDAVKDIYFSYLEGKSPSFSLGDAGKKDFYLGPGDGMGLRRVADNILNNTVGNI